MIKKFYKKVVAGIVAASFLFMPVAPAEAATTSYTVGGRTIYCSSAFDSSLALSYTKIISGQNSIPSVNATYKYGSNNSMSVYTRTDYATSNDSSGMAQCIFDLPIGSHHVSISAIHKAEFDGYSKTYRSSCSY